MSRKVGPLLTDCYAVMVRCKLQRVQGYICSIGRAKISGLFILAPIASSELASWPSSNWMFREERSEIRDIIVGANWSPFSDIFSLVSKDTEVCIKPG